MKKFLVILPIALLLLSCGKTGHESSEEHPVLFSLDTKSLGEEERTFRVALFNASHYFAAQGTYCNVTLYHSSGDWLSPCRVMDETGMPRKSDDDGGGEADNLSQADKDSKYGLRYGTDGLYYIVAASPAKAFSSDGNLRYYPWTPATATDIYVSEPVVTPLTGTWLDGEYVYESSRRSALTLKNRSASIKVHIECGAQDEADIQSVALLNLVTAARWYMTSGFSATPAHYTIDSYTLFDYLTNGGIMTLTKETLEDPAFTWTSSKVYLPSIDFSDNTFTAMRPVIEVRMGDDPAHPAIALIDITEKVEPMKNYTYNLKVSKSQVYIYLTVAAWDELPGGDINSTDSETHGLIRTVSVSNWTNVELTAQDWNNSF